MNRLLVIAFVVSNLFWIGASNYNANNVRKETDKKWRQAAQPVFAARNISLLAETATPHDLQRALDATSAMTWQEDFKLGMSYHHKGEGTLIIIAPAGEKWARTQ